MSYAGLCNKELVSGEEYSISDNNIKASSSFDSNHGPKRSRLNTISDAGGR